LSACRRFVQPPHQHHTSTNTLPRHKGQKNSTLSRRSATFSRSTRTCKGGEGRQELGRWTKADWEEALLAGEDGGRSQQEAAHPWRRWRSRRRRRLEGFKEEAGAATELEGTPERARAVTDACRDDTEGMNRDGLSRCRRWPCLERVEEHGHKVPWRRGLVQLAGGRGRGGAAPRALEVALLGDGVADACAAGCGRGLGEARDEGGDRARGSPSGAAVGAGACWCGLEKKPGDSIASDENCRELSAKTLGGGRL
jgi:hypothetical protein